MPEIKINQLPSHGDPENRKLNRFQRNVYSQAGEDGVLEEIFRIIGPGTKWCVEFGAWDGVHLSNTCRLIREENWSAVLIEGDEKRCEEIAQNHPYPDRVFPAHRWVGFERGNNTIDDILSDTPIPEEFDLISIDVDSIDWHIWESIVDYRPRVVVIEFNPTIPNAIEFVQDKDMGINEGNSLAAMIALGKTKGYELVCATSGNGFFVVKEEFDKFGITDNSIWTMRPDRTNFVWASYNGKLYHSMKGMPWWGKNVALRPDSLQLISEFVAFGRKQGRADEHLHVEASGPRDLTTADGILRELFELRGNRKEIDEAEWSERSRNAWVAAKKWTMQKQSWQDVSDEDAEATADQRLSAEDV